MPRLLSVNVGQPKDADWAGIGRTSIDKRPVTGPVKVTELGVDGRPGLRHRSTTAGSTRPSTPTRARTSTSGRPSSGLPIRDGQFGENLTTEGIDLNRAASAPGCGSATSCSRSPASARRATTSSAGWASAASTTRPGSSGSPPSARPGPYLRVARDRLAWPPATRSRSCTSPTHGVTVGDLFVALNLDRTRLPELLAIDGLAPEAAARGRRISRSVGGFATGGGPGVI